jgi:hypothetical protein
MDEHRIPVWIRSLGGFPSRRDVCRGLVGAGLALSAARLPDAAAAKKKRKHKKRKPRATPNEFGCLEVGDPCQSADQCCSGACVETNGNRKCQAHDVGSCSALAEPEACGGTDVFCVTSSGQDGTCGTTTGKAGYCIAGGECSACKTDADCQAAENGLFGPHAACVRCADCNETGGTACAAPDPIKVVIH